MCTHRRCCTRMRRPIRSRRIAINSIRLPTHHPTRPIDTPDSFCLPHRHRYRHPHYLHHHRHHHHHMRASPIRMHGARWPRTRRRRRGECTQRTGSRTISSAIQRWWHSTRESPPRYVRFPPYHRTSCMHLSYAPPYARTLAHSCTHPHTHTPSIYRQCARLLGQFANDLLV